MSNQCRTNLWGSANNPVTTMTNDPQIGARAKWSPYWATHDPGPQMIPTLECKWSWTPNGPHNGAHCKWSPNWTTNNPGSQLIPKLECKWSPYWTANNPEPQMVLTSEHKWSPDWSATDANQKIKVGVERESSHLKSWQEYNLLLPTILSIEFLLL